MVQLEHYVMVEGTAGIRVNGCGGGKLLVVIILLNPVIHQGRQGCSHKQVRLKKQRNLLWEQSGVQASPRVDDDTSQMTLWYLSRIPLDWGWKAVVGEWRMPSKEHRQDQRDETNWVPLSEVMVWGTLNQDIQEEKRAEAQSEADIEDRGEEPLQPI